MFYVKMDGTGAVVATLRTEGPLPSGYVDASEVGDTTRDDIEHRRVRSERGAWVPVPARPVRVLSRLDFARLFTMAEDIAIDAAGSADGEVRFFYRRLELAGAVNLDHPDVTAGLTLLVQKRLLTAERKAAILANQPPA